MFAQQLKNKIDNIKSAIEAEKQRMYDKARHEFCTFEDCVREMKPYFDTLFANKDDLIAIEKKTFVLDFCTIYVDSCTVVFSSRDVCSLEGLDVIVQPDDVDGLHFEYKVNSGIPGVHRPLPFPHDVVYTVSSFDELVQTSKHDCWINFFIGELSKINRSLRVNVDSPDSVGDCILNFL